VPINGPPYCAARNGSCITLDKTVAAFDVGLVNPGNASNRFRACAVGWADPEARPLTYEFGLVAAPAAAAAAARGAGAPAAAAGGSAAASTPAAQQLQPPLASASHSACYVFGGLPVGPCTLYVCAVDALGAKTCQQVRAAGACVLLARAAGARCWCALLARLRGRPSVEARVLVVGHALTDLRRLSHLTHHYPHPHQHSHHHTPRACRPTWRCWSRHTGPPLLTWRHSWSHSTASSAAAHPQTRTRSLTRRARCALFGCGCVGVVRACVRALDGTRMRLLLLLLLLLQLCVLLACQQRWSARARLAHTTSHRVKPPHSPPPTLSHIVSHR
jgi:hypothetical protein